MAADDDDGTNTSADESLHKLDDPASGAAALNGRGTTDMKTLNAVGQPYVGSEAELAEARDGYVSIAGARPTRDTGEAESADCYVSSRDRYLSIRETGSLHPFAAGDGSSGDPASLKDDVSTGNEELNSAADHVPSLEGGSDTRPDDGLGGDPNRNQADNDGANLKRDDVIILSDPKLGIFSETDSGTTEHRHPDPVSDDVPPKTTQRRRKPSQP